MRILLVLPLLLLSVELAAQDKKVYRWVDRNGVVHYTDQPPSSDARPAQLPALQTYEPKAPPPPSAPVRPAAPAAAAPRLNILSPVADETFRDPSGVVTISVEASPASPGLRFRYYLDGAPLTEEPIAASSFTATGIIRGSHTVSVAAVDAQGREVARAGPQPFHMKPPTVARPRP